MKFRFKFSGWIALILFAALFFSACQPPEQQTTGNTANRAGDSARQPTIEVESAQIDGEYKIVTGESLKLTVRAADANQAEILYQPVIAADRLIRLRTLTEHSDGNFTTEMPLPQDFNGEVWARVRYADGETKQTDRLMLAVGSANGQNDQQVSQTDQNQAEDSEESARSDKVTGGRIERAELKPGDGNIRVTVNVPAFQLTLWQSGKEIAVYPVGVGKKSHPIPVGARSSDQIILNPNWIPPDSDWVRESTSVEPYERIEADDPDNPLGKIKIPLGNAYLLHEAQSSSDLGSLVSHGCVRVMREDIYDLTEKIATARGLSDAKEKIQQSRNDSERRFLNFDESFPVIINYDSMVVEGGVLRIYPDVYDRDTNTVEKLREELQRYDIDVSKLDEQTLKEMLDRVTDEQFFAVSLNDIRAGNTLNKGETRAIIESQKKTGSAGSNSSNSNSSDNRSSNSNNSNNSQRN